MGYKQIVFPGAAATANAAANAAADGAAALTTFDYIMIGTLVVLVAVAVYWIATTQQSVTRVERFAERAREAHDARELQRLLHDSTAMIEVEETNTKRYRVVYLYMSGCPYCVKFDKTHAAATTDAELSRKFTFDEKINISSAAAEPYKQYKCNGFPCYLVFDGQGQMVERGTGYRQPNDFKSWLTSLLPTV